MSLAAKLAIQRNNKRFNQGDPQRLAVHINSRRFNNNGQQPRNNQGDPIMEAKSLTMTQPRCQAFPMNRTKVVNGVNGLAIKCGPKANGCKPGCSGTPLCACGAAPIEGQNCALGAAPARLGLRNIGSGQVAKLEINARTDFNRIKKDICSPHGRNSGRYVSEGELTAQIRGEAAASAGIVGTRNEDPVRIAQRNCEAALFGAVGPYNASGNVGTIFNGQRVHNRECKALEVLAPEPGYEQVQNHQHKLCALRLPTVKRTTPLSGEELAALTADSERRMQQIRWENDVECPAGCCGDSS